MKDAQTKRLVLAGVLSAMIIVLTALVSIPLPSGHGYINLGDAGVLTAALVLGGPWGALCCGVASAAADLMLGWGVYAPATFIIKGGMAMLAVLFVKNRSHTMRHWAIYPAALLVPVGYFLFETVIYGSAAALPNVPLNLIQCLIGAGIAHAVVTVLGRKGLISVFVTNTAKAQEYPQICAEPVIVREPKGGPDVVLIGCEQELTTLLKAGDHLSVRGYTARIVKLPPKSAFDTLTLAQREMVVPEGIPYIAIAECGALQGAEAADIAKAALEAIQA